MQVTPSEKSYRLLVELSKLTGKAPATIVREILDEGSAGLEMAIEGIRLVQQRPEETRAAMVRIASHAHTAISQASFDLNTDRKPGRKPKKGQGAANTG